jgi:hypothetical protein
MATVPYEIKLTVRKTVPLRLVLFFLADKGLWSLLMLLVGFYIGVLVGWLVGCY